MEQLTIAVKRPLTELDDGVSALGRGGSASVASQALDEGKEETEVWTKRSVLIGREEETNQLSQIFRRVVRDGLSKTILIEGSAGTGKTSLVETLRGEISLTDGCFVSGKFDQIPRKDPYSAIVAAFDDICDLVLNRDVAPEPFDDITVESNSITPQQKSASSIDLVRDALERTLGKRELREFSRLVSGISRITGDAVPLNALGLENGCAMGQAFLRFQMCCRGFLQSIASETHPIVIFFDDLQFADDASVEVIQNMMQCTMLRYVLIIASFRDDKKGPHMKLVSLANECGVLSEQTAYIKLENLNVSSVNEMLSQSLEADPKDTLSLSSICFAKTLGNPYFLQQYIRLLKIQELLVFSPSENRWHWDEEMVQSETDVLGNIIDVLTARAQIVGKEVQHILKYAAMLGFMFEIDVLHVILDPYHRSRVEQVVTIARKEGFIESGRKNMYKWTHDRVMQCFDGLILEKDRAKMNFQIGESIRNSDLPMTDQRLHLVANQYNLGVSYVTKAEDKLFLAQLNFDVGRSSMQVSAYKSGQHYFETGMQLLPAKKWKDCRQLTLGLYNGATTAAYCNGDTHTLNMTSETILKYAEATEEKLPALLIRMSMLSTQGRFYDSIEAGFRVLHEIGVKVNRQPRGFHIFLKIMQLQRMLRGKSDADILSLPTMDEKTAAVLPILHIIGRSAYLSTFPELHVMVSLHMLVLSLRNGISRYAPEAFAIYGLIQKVMKCFRESDRYGQLAIRMAEERFPNRVDSMATFVVSGFTTSGLHHLTKSRELLMRINRHAEDVAGALMCAGGEIQVMFYGGYNLLKVNKLSQEYRQQMIEFNEVSSLIILEPLMQAILNLLGEAEAHPAKLLGEIIPDPVKFMEKLKMENHAIGVVNFLSQSLVVAAMLDSWGIAEEYVHTIKQFGKATTAAEPYFASQFRHLALGLIYIGLYQKNRNRSSLFAFRRLKGVMKRDLKIGLLSSQPLLKFLVAEELSLKGSKDDIQHAYDVAAEELRQVRYTHFEGLAYEHAGDVLARRFNDAVSANQYYSWAIECYREWGAVVKEEHVDKKISRLSLVNNPRQDSHVTKNKK